MRIIYLIIFKHIKIVLAKPQATSVQHLCQYCDCHSILLYSWLRGTSARPLDPSGAGWRAVVRALNSHGRGQVNSSRKGRSEQGVVRGNSSSVSFLCTTLEDDFLPQLQFRCLKDSYDN